MNISLDEKELFELFSEAFDEGKNSFSDLRDGAVELILIRLKVIKGFIHMPVEEPEKPKKKLKEHCFYYNYEIFDKYMTFNKNY